MSYVRVKPTVLEPRHGWDGVTHGDVGLVVDKRPDQWVVCFPAAPRWLGFPDELEVVPPCVRVGDAVRIKPGVQPLNGLGGLLPGDLGAVAAVHGILCIVDFPGCFGVRLYMSELEAAELEELGDEQIVCGSFVEVRSTILLPRLGWQHVKPGDVGAVVTIAGAACEVDFPSRHNDAWGTKWRGYLSELQLVELPDLRVGMHVKFRAGHSGLVPREYGRVVSVEGIRCRIDFPSQTAWPALRPELEIVRERDADDSDEADEEDAAPFLPRQMDRRLCDCMRKLERRERQIAERERRINILGETPVNCKICFGANVDRVAGCGHSFCARCIGQMPTCAFCRKPITDVKKLFL